VELGGWAGGGAAIGEPLALAEDWSRGRGWKDSANHGGQIWDGRGEFVSGRGQPAASTRRMLVVQAQTRFELLGAMVNAVSMKTIWKRKMTITPTS
jgi:hypothetical protein